jgi:hypothetical protein
MSATSQYPTYTVKDALKSANIALPNAANTVNTAAIDLESTKAFPTTGDFCVQMSNTAGTGARPPAKPTAAIPAMAR